METKEIKKAIKSEFAAFTPNPIMEIAIKYILELENDLFWKEEAAPYIGNALNLVMEFAKTGLLINGSSGNKIAKINQTTGEIIVGERKI